MPPLITLMLLACAPIVVGYLAWRSQFPRGVTTQDRQQATNGQGERPMTGEMEGPEVDRMVRWMKDSPAVFEGVHRILREREQSKEAAGAAQKECERLRQQGEALREEVRRLQAETERLQKERADTAQWFAAMMKEAAARLRVERPPA